MMHGMGMFERKGPNTLEGFEGCIESHLRELIE